MPMVIIIPGYKTKFLVYQALGFRIFVLLCFAVKAGNLKTMNFTASLCNKLFQHSSKRTLRFFNSSKVLQDNFSCRTKFISNSKPKCLQSQVSTCYQPVRYYAKTKDKQKSGKGQLKKVQINEELLTEVINPSLMKEQMQDAVKKLKDDFVKNLSLRSTSGSIETLPISFEGKDYILQDLAQIVRKNPKTVVVNMISFPQVIPTVIQALSKSGMNLSPQQDGTTLFIPIPKVTKEHRETLSKNAKALFIKCRDSIKDIQNKFIKTVKNKEKDGLAKDSVHQINEYITYTANEYISSAEKMLETKQQELLKE